jgi:ABC-2 type transport system ATP-binding protein
MSSQGVGIDAADRPAERDAAGVDPDDAAIHVEGLTKRFGSGEEAVTAVEDLDLTVGTGSVVGLLGPNGAGKTTAIKSILGLVVPDEGSVLINGIDVHANPRRAYHHVDAMLEGARNDYWRLTVRENLRYFATIGGEKPAAVADRHDRLLEQLELADKADQPVRDLSRGMKQKVSLASVLARDVDVVFLDEPTLGLDVESSLTLRSELQRIVDDRNLTVVLCSHDMDVIEDVCDRVVIVNDGRVIADDTVANLVGAFDARGYRITSRNLDDADVAAIRERFEVVEVRRFDPGVRFEVAVDSDEFYRLMRLLESRGIAIDGVETVTPDLEEVFVEMTGGGRE